MKQKIILLTGLLIISGCAIKPVVVDRHTLMEAESAGSWPDVDKKVLERSKKKGATFFQKEELRGKMARPYQVLNGEPVDPSLAGNVKPVAKKD